MTVSKMTTTNVLFRKRTWAIYNLGYGFYNFRPSWAHFGLFELTEAHWCLGQEKNTLNSGNACDEKNLRPGGCEMIFLINLNLLK